MKIVEGVKLKGKPAEIPDCGRDDLPGFFKERRFKVGVEIGVFKGEYTEVLAKSGLQIYGVDPWMFDEDYGEPAGQHKTDKYCAEAMERLAPYLNVHIIKEKSMEALSYFKDESLDFVYIDGNHKFRYIADDMFEWEKKLKKGGVLSGHDYAYFKSQSPCGGCQVREIVDAYAKAFKTNFWVLGNYKPSKGEYRDHYRSWMFIK